MIDIVEELVDGHSLLGVRNVRGVKSGGASTHEGVWLKGARPN